jgi:hypothetical protein
MAENWGFQAVLDGLFARLGKEVSRGVAEGIQRSGLLQKIQPVIRASPGRRNPKPDRSRGTSETCSIAGCKLQTRSKGLCSKHYERAQNQEKKEGSANKAIVVPKTAPVKKKTKPVASTKSVQKGTAKRVPQANVKKKIAAKKITPRSASRKNAAKKSAPIATARKASTRKRAINLLRPHDQQTDSPAILEPVLPIEQLPAEIEAETVQQQSEPSELKELVGDPGLEVIGSGVGAVEESQPSPDAAVDALPGPSENDPQDCGPCGGQEGIAERQEETLTDGQSAEVQQEPDL